MGGNSFTPACISHMFSSCCLDVDGGCRYLAATGQIGLHVLKIGSQLGSLADDGDIGVADTEMLLLDQLVHFFQQQQAVDPFVLQVGIGEMATNVACAKSPQQCVGKRMGNDIGIGVPIKSKRIIDGYAT